MNEPNLAVAMVYLSALAAALVLPAPLLAYSARLGTRPLWLTAAAISVIPIALAVWALGGRSPMNGGDEALYRNLAILAVVATVIAAWAVEKRRRQNPAASFLSLLGTAASRLIGCVLVFAVMPHSC